MILADRSVFISYSWGAEKKHPLVDRLLAALKEKSIEVKRDSNAINYGDSIRAYMDELAAGRAIILVLSEEYFKSPNCMYELREIYFNSRKEFRQRIFPVVLEKTPLHSPEDQILYIDYWEKKTKEFDNNLDLISRRNVSHDLLRKLKDYDDFAKLIGELQSLISDMYCPKEEELLKTGFAVLIERIFSHNPPSGGGGTDKTGHEKAAAKLGTLFGVPDPPPNHFDRPEYLDQLRAAVLQDDTQAVGITGKRQHVGVQGMGGLGKSVLAAALAHDEAVRAAFPDGIFWLRFRQNADDAYLLEQQAEILKIIAPSPLPDTLVNGENLLTLALENKRCLFIADDIWDSGHLRHFVPKSKGCRLLLTTRKAEVIKKINAVACELALLSEPQARQFLAVCSGCAENDLPDEAAAIVQECGRLPLALAAIGSMVKGHSAKRWQMALEKLQNARLDKIRADLTLDYDYKNLFKVFQVSVEDLPPEVQAYYKTLIVFPEDAKIPESVLQLYWEHCPQGDYEWQDAVDLLVARSLLSREKDEFVTLHDLLRDYLRHQSGDEEASLHKQLLEAYRSEYPGGWHTIPYEKPYYFHFHWYLHAQATGDMNFPHEIADDLIRRQPMIGPESIDTALRFVKYTLSDIAHNLLKESRNTWILIKCLSIYGYDTKEDAKRLMKESDDSFVFEKCVKILGEEAKDICKIKLKESSNVEILEICLRFLGEEAKEGARYLLSANKDELLRLQCIELLGIEAKDAALRLIDTTQDKFIPQHCMDILNSWEQDDTEE